MAHIHNIVTSKMKALVGAESGGYRFADDIKVPALRPGTMLCRVHAVALSPYDAKIVDYSNTPGAVGGCDFSGIVLKLGEGVTRFKEGDRVLAVTFGLNATDREAGAFADYALATEDLSCHVPDDVSLTEASSMALSIATAGLALFEKPGLALPMECPASGEEDASAFVLVSGGATGTGTMATQLLKHAGYKPIVTCSPANNVLCKYFGAVACFDYNSPMCGVDIREYTGNGLSYVFDCVTDTPTMKMCYEAINPSGGKYIALESVSPIIKYTRRNVSADWLMAPTIMGTALDLPGAYGRPCTPHHREFGARLFKMAEDLLREKRIMNHPVDVRAGGLDKIPTYLNDLRTGKVRAKRQVVRMYG